MPKRLDPKQKISDNIGVDSLALVRHRLGSIDLSDVEREMDENERREYCSTISAVFPRLERDIKKFLHEQLLFISNNAEAWEQVIFARGTFNGMDILLNHWEKANAEHLKLNKDKNEKEPENHNPIATIDA